MSNKCTLNVFECNPRNASMRDLAMTDKNKRMLMLIATIWNSEAENFIWEKYSSIVIRNGTVIDLEGKKKSNCLSGTSV